MILFNHLHIARERARGVGRTTRLSGREGDRRQSNESGKRGKRDEKEAETVAEALINNRDSYDRKKRKERIRTATD